MSQSTDSLATTFKLQRRLNQYGYPSAMGDAMNKYDLSMERAQQACENPHGWFEPTCLRCKMKV